MKDIYTNIRAKLNEIPISPIFFIGSGISRRYINSPDWKNMLKEVMDGWDKSFERQYQNYVKNGKCDFELLGKLLEDEYYNDILLDSNIIEGKEKSYYFRKKISDLLASYVCKYAHDLDKNEEILELRKTTPSTVITTNYDNLLEDYVFNKYHVYVGQEQLLSNVLHGVGDIYKIHGCIKTPESIIVTKGDYNNFRERSVYLNSKLLTLFLEYPIIFMGYSFSDENIKGIFDTIVKMIPNKSKELSERIWFLKRNESDDLDYSNIERIELEEGRYLDVEVFYVKNFADFYRVLNEARFNKLPIEFLRYMKSNVYKLVASQVSDPKLIDVNVCDISRIKDFKECKMAFTLSSDNMKISAITKEEICDSFIADKYDNIDLKSIIKRISEENNLTWPIYRVMKDIGYTECIDYINEVCNNKKLIEKIDSDKNYKIDIGVNNNYKFNYLGEISETNVDNYLKSYLETSGMEKYVQNRSKNTCRRYFIVYLITNRLKELIISETFIQSNKSDVIKAITNLDDNFIKNNKDDIYRLIQTLKIGKYNLEFRKMLCHIDKSLYKEEFIMSKIITNIKNQDIDKLEVAYSVENS